jgi:hypothetical protein
MGEAVQVANHLIEDEFEIAAHRKMIVNPLSILAKVQPENI